MYNGLLTDVDDIKVGHFQDYSALTGTTVIIPVNGAVCGVDVRGSAPGTRETDLLKPENLVEKVNAVMLSGGSAYGLDAASGIMHYLEENDMGMDVTVCKVPIVVGAVIFDLTVGSNKIRPDFKMGYEACKNATFNNNLSGCIGGGTGACVGKILGKEFAMKSGIGQASISIGDFKIAALTVLNAFGDVYDAEKNIQIAGAYSKQEKKFLDTMKIYEKNLENYNVFNKATNTTISIVATNANLTKANCNKISQMAHDGFARSIIPVHTMFDGDTIFTLSTGKIDVDISFAGAMAAKVISRSIANAIYTSKSYDNLPSYQDITN